MDRLTEMEAFTTVVEQGGFTGAAKKLGVSKSAISKHVSSLEARLGVLLLARTTRRVDPTDVGMVYYERALQILGSARDADQLVSASSASPTGNLRVAVQDEWAGLIVSRLVPSFLQRYPDLSLTITPAVGYTELNADGYDVLVRTGSEPDASLQVHEVAELPFRLVASPEYLKQAGRPTRVEELAQHPMLQCLGWQGNGGFNLQMRSGEVRFVHGTGRLIARDSEALVQSTLQGLGIAFLPEFLVNEEIASARLLDAMPELPPQVSKVYLAHQQGPGTAPKLKAFVHHLIAESHPQNSNGGLKKAG